jgi:hypothetical protein
MEIKINVDGEQFEKLIKNGIESLSEDNFKQILTEGIIKALSTDEVISKILVNNYYTSYGNKRLTDFAEDLIRSSDVKTKIDELKEKIADELINNHKSLVYEAMLYSMTTQTYEALRPAIEHTVRDTLYRMQQQ